MITPHTRMKWLMNIYPPLLFNRIVAKRISPDFKEIDVIVKKSWMNRNMQGTIFGGTIFSAADPFFSMMYWKIFTLRGLKMEAWVKCTEADFKKPGASDLSLKFRISEEDIKSAEQSVNEKGKIVKWHTIQALDTQGDTCAEIKILVYIRKAKEKDKSVF